MKPSRRLRLASLLVLLTQSCGDDDDGGGFDETGGDGPVERGGASGGGASNAGASPSSGGDAGSPGGEVGSPGGEAGAGGQGGDSVGGKGSGKSGNSGQGGGSAGSEPLPSGAGGAGEAGSSGAAGEGVGGEAAGCAAFLPRLEARWQEVPVNPSAAPPARFLASLSAVPGHDSLLLFGGATFLFGNTEDAWTFEGGGWFQVDGSGPPARSAHAMVGVDSLDAVLLFGGAGDAPLADTWLWDGGWSLRCSGTDGECGTVPSARSGHVLTYDSLRDTVVLFGGHDGTSARSDTWEWTLGGGWVERCTPSDCESGGCCPPEARFDHAMTFDKMRGLTVLYGGSNGGMELDDLWTWDGSQWLQESVPPGPGPRAGHAMGYDEREDATIVYGGVQRGEALGDVWTLNAGDGLWAQGSAASEPPARAFAAAGWDPGAERLAVFGGGFVGELADFWQLEVDLVTAGDQCTCFEECLESCSSFDEVACGEACFSGSSMGLACPPDETGGAGGASPEGGASGALGGGGAGGGGAGVSGGSGGTMGNPSGGDGTAPTGGTSTGGSD